MEVNREICLLTSELTSQSAGTPRLERVTRFFLEKKCKVTLIDTSSFYYNKKYLFESIIDFELFRDNIVKNKSFKNGSKTGFKAQILRKIKHLLLLDFISLSLFVGILNILFKEKSFSHIYASSPNPRNIILAYIFKRKQKNTVLNIDLRDEWALHRHIYFHKRIRKFIEMVILVNADFVTTVSNGIKHKLEREYNINHVKVNYNYSRKTPNLSEERKIALRFFVDETKINFFYAGTMPNGYYNEDLFMLFLDKLYKSKIINRIRFNFFGFKGEIRNKITNSKYNDFFFFNPSMTHDEVLYLMEISDVLLFFAYDKPNNGGIVSTKLLEYINSGTRVLPFSIKPSSDVDYLFSKSCKKSVYLNGLNDLNQILIEDDFLRKLPCKKNNKFLKKIEETNFKNLNNFLNL